MTTREGAQAAREALTDDSTSPERVEAAVRELLRDGAVGEARELVERRIDAGSSDETNRVLRVELTLRDVQGLGDAERLDRAKRLLDAERDENERLDPAFDHLFEVWDKQDALYRAEQIFSLDDEHMGSGGALVALAKRLKRHSVFADARRVFGVAKNRSDLSAGKRLYARQQEALCTYKDPTMPRIRRLDRALKLLEDDIEANPTAETLGLAGAIYKRRWEVGNRLEDLKFSRQFYERGHAESWSHPRTMPADGGVAERNWSWDAGYTGINAAFVLDKLAGLEPDDAEAERLRSKAIELRAELARELGAFQDDPEVAQISKNDWWMLVTLVEAEFGCALAAAGSESRGESDLEGGFASVRRWVEAAKELPGTPPWELRSTAEQLVELTRVHGVNLRDRNDPVARQARSILESLLGDRKEGLDVILRGKIGLALSGGGFRASLYHLGVLAKLAELDVLRHVEVISCVSGGSIVGAHYFLELRNWLQTHPETAPPGEPRVDDRAAYVEIVERARKSFLAGVQRNPRVRVATNLWSSLKTLFSPTYSRTERLGELYDRLLFSAVNDGEGHRERTLNRLFVEPEGERPMAFVAPRDNWLRRWPVPILILNATTLNTGHNWQFTPTWMGESRWSIDEKIDGNARLRRPYFWQAPARYREFPLGRAVAASSCVPGLFEPIVLPGLYPGYAVRLVDGGVHDNQGVAGLYEQDCSWLIVSDASGQMTTQELIDGGSLESFGRMSNIQMARIREEQLKGLEASTEDRRVRGSVTVHLREGLTVEPVSWEGYEGKPPPPRSGAHAVQDLRKDVLEPLSAIRTDLDSFHDTEAFALMTAGYKMVEAKAETFERAGLGSPAPSKPAWEFTETFEAPMADRTHPRHEPLKRILAKSASLSGKILFLEPVRSLVVLALLAAAGAAVGWGVNRLAPGFWGRAVELLPSPLCWVLGIAALVVYKAVANRVVLGAFFVRHALSSTLFSLLLIALWPLAWLHLKVFDRRYVAYGKVE